MSDLEVLPDLFVNKDGTAEVSPLANKSVGVNCACKLQLAWRGVKHT